LITATATMTPSPSDPGLGTTPEGAECPVGSAVVRSQERRKLRVIKAPVGLGKLRRKEFEGLRPGPPGSACQRPAAPCPLLGEQTQGGEVGEVVA
jgi:hypothetical protein